MTARLPFAARRDEAELAAPEPTLVDVLAEVRALRSELACLRVPRLSAVDFAMLARLLPAIREAAGDSVWTAADLAALAVLPGRGVLAEALAPLVRDRGGLRSLGKALARAAGHNVNGYRLAQVGTDRAGALWQVRRV